MGYIPFFTNILYQLPLAILNGAGCFLYEYAAEILLLKAVNNFPHGRVPALAAIPATIEKSKPGICCQKWLVYRQKDAVVVNVDVNYWHQLAFR